MIMSLEWANETLQDVIIYRIEGDYLPGALLDMLPFFHEMLEESYAPTVNIIVDQSSANNPDKIPMLSNNPAFQHPKTGNIVVVQNKEQTVSVKNVQIFSKSTWVAHSMESAFNILNGSPALVTA